MTLNGFGHNRKTVNLSLYLLMVSDDNGASLSTASNEYFQGYFYGYLELNVRLPFDLEALALA